MVMMSKSGWERQALGSIAGGLADSDPTLASMLNIPPPARLKQLPRVGEATCVEGDGETTAARMSSGSRRHRTPTTSTAPRTVMYGRLAKASRRGFQIGVACPWMSAMSCKSELRLQMQRRTTYAGDSGAAAPLVVFWRQEPKSS
jgi:hypothetical protein